MDQVNQAAAEKPVLYVLRQFQIASYYAAPGVRVESFDTDFGKVPAAGDWLLLTTRANVDLDYLPGAPIVLRIGRLGAAFCVVKQAQ